MILRILQTAALAIALTIALGPALAQEAAPPEASEPSDPVRIEIDLSLILAEAREAARAGNLDRAVELYRVILRFAPSSRTARIELSAILTMQGDRQRAAALLRDIETDGLAPDVIDLIDRLAGPDRLTFFLAPEIFLDSNIAGQTSERSVPFAGGTLVLNDDARGNHGYGYGVTVGANYRLTDADPRTTLTGGVSIRDFEGGPDDQQTGFASVSMHFDVAEVAITPSLSTAYRYDDWRPREAEFGGGLAGTVTLGPIRNTLGGRYRHLDDARDDSSILDREIYEVYDAIAFGVDQFGFRLEQSYTEEDWRRREDLDNWATESRVDVTFVGLPWVVPTIGGSFIYRDFENPADFFGILREDRVYEGRIELLLREITLFGTHPFIRYEHTESDSNHPLFDFDKDEIFIGLRAVTW